MRVIYSAAIVSNEHTFFTNEHRQLFVIIREIIQIGFDDQSITTAQSDIILFQMIIQSMMGVIYNWGLKHSGEKLVELGRPLIMQLVRTVHN